MRKCQTTELGGERGPGRGMKTWQECVKDDRRVLGMESLGAGSWEAWREGHSVIRGDRLTRARVDLADIKPVMMMMIMNLVHLDIIAKHQLSLILICLRLRLYF